MLIEILCDVWAILFENIIKRNDESIIDSSLRTTYIRCPLVLNDIRKIAGNLKNRELLTKAMSLS